MAVKFLVAGGCDDLLRFRREALILRRLVHETVLRVLDAVQVEVRRRAK